MRAKLANRDVIAEVISRVFDPVWEVPLALLLAVGFAIQEGLRWRFLGVLLFVDALLPMIFFAIMLWHHQIRDWDIQNRIERIPLFVFTLLCHLAGLWLSALLGKTELVHILVVYYVASSLFLGVTLFWKISLHTGVNAVLLTTLNFFTEWRYWYLMAILILVGWARVWQRHHTLGQVIAGALLGGVGVSVGLVVVRQIYG